MGLMANRDAILVLGGGLRANNQLPEYVQRRFDRALELQAREPIVALSAWTMHRAVRVDDDGHQLLESQAGVEYLLARGVPANLIFREATSYDTIGNAYFSRVQFVDPMHWRNLLVITSEFHMQRTEAIFRWVYSLDAPAPFHLQFMATENAGLNNEELRVRREHEVRSIQAIEKLNHRLTSLPALATWLFSEHEAYAPIRPAAGRGSDPNLLATY